MWSGVGRKDLGVVCIKPATYDINDETTQTLVGLEFDNPKAGAVVYFCNFSGSVGRSSLAGGFQVKFYWLEISYESSDLHSLFGRR